MRTQLILLSCILTIQFCKIQAQVPTNDLIAYYLFNGNSLDESGNNIDPDVINGATLTTDRFGNPNSAYYFDGVDD